MLLRDAQEQARILYVAKRDSGPALEDAFTAHLREANEAIKALQEQGKPICEALGVNPSRAVGVLLLVALETANALNVDALAALTDVLHTESP